MSKYDASGTQVGSWWTASALLHRLWATQSDFATLLLRLTVAGVIFPHGAQKLLGWFGGYGFSGTMEFFTQKMGIPPLLALAAILAESVGAVALAAGFFSRLSALAIGVVMAVATITTQLPNGFFMNWFGNQKGEGIEYSLLMLGLTAALVLRGGGALALDTVLARLVQRGKAIPAGTSRTGAAQRTAISAP